MNSTEEILTAVVIGLLVGDFLLNTGRYRKSIELLKECLVLLNNKVVKMGERSYLNIYMSLTFACHNAGDPRQAIEYGEKALAISKEIGDRRKEDVLYGNLGNVYQSLGECVKAREFHEKALALSIEIGDRRGEGVDYNNLGNVYNVLCEYVKAREFLEKALPISIEIGDRRGEGVCNANLGRVHQSLGEYVKAREFHEKALAISIEIGDRREKGICYGNLGNVYQYLGQHVKAREFLEKALAICIEIGNRQVEGAHNGSLGNVYQSLGEYVKAREFHEKALEISIEIGDRHEEGTNFGNIGNVYQSLGECVKAREFHEKALAIRIEIGDRRGEGFCYGNLGKVYNFLGEYVKAREFHEKALEICIEIGNRQVEGVQNGSLGNVCQSLGEYVKAREFHEKALAIYIEIGDRREEEIKCYGNLGNVNQYLGEYVKAREFIEKALAISIEIGSKREEGICRGNLGNVYHSLGEYAKARELFEKALAISIEIGDRRGEAACYFNLGTVYLFHGFYGPAEENFKKGLAIAFEIGTVDLECKFHCNLALLYVVMIRMKEALTCFSAAIERFEELRGFLGKHDLYKINFAEQNSFPYELLATILCSKREIIEALLVSELGRARALADLMSAQYSVKGLSYRLALVDIEQTMRNEKSTCTGLYISFVLETMHFWIIKVNERVLFQKINIDTFAAIPNFHESSLQEYVESLANQSYRHLAVLKGEYEDRSLFTFYESEPQCQDEAEGGRASCRLVEVNEEEQEQEPALRSLYKVLISPVADRLEGSEIIICPEPLLYQVPFAALMDEDEKFLSQKFRIRLIPSLTTLKQIQDSPADYHSQTGALIVGDPDVGRTDLSPLPCAREEARIIARLLHVQPLIGQEATKQAVLQSMRSVSLIHIAAHGDAKRGEIALAPLRPMNGTPQKEDFMLTMADVSEVQLRAKLVVLSCCHSGRGEIRNEGVIGIARAFLGSGARSVLVSLWAVDDRATKEFMREFYEHLSGGESASECLHEAMKWMRGRPQYCAVRQWAPFMLIGDNVTFNFEELTRDQRSNNT